MLPELKVTPEMVFVAVSEAPEPDNDVKPLMPARRT